MRPNIPELVNKNMSYIVCLGHMCTYTYIQAKSNARSFKAKEDILMFLSASFPDAIYVANTLSS